MSPRRSGISFPVEICPVTVGFLVSTLERLSRRQCQVLIRRACEKRTAKFPFGAPTRVNFQRMDMTSTVMIRVDTLDRFSSEHRAVGYALVAVFMDPSGNQVPHE